MVTDISKAECFQHGKTRVCEKNLYEKTHSTTNNLITIQQRTNGGKHCLVLIDQDSQVMQLPLDKFGPLLHGIGSRNCKQNTQR